MKRQLMVFVPLLLLVTACEGTNQECRACPAVEGSWLMVYEAPATACPNAPTPPSTIVVRRIGSVVRADILGTTFSGTAFDTFDFSLRGTITRGDGGFPADGGLETDTAEFRGKYIPGGGDGGTERIRGTWSVSPAPGDCTETRDFNGLRP